MHLDCAETEQSGFGRIQQSGINTIGIHLYPSWMVLDPT